MPRWRTRLTAFARSERMDGWPIHHSFWRDDRCGHRVVAVQRPEVWPYLGDTDYLRPTGAVSAVGCPYHH
jgi:hypothetical protein